MTTDVILLPLARVFDAATAVRNIAYDRRWVPEVHVPIPVLSVGNISVGGSGKSPFAAYLVQELLKQQRRPAILSRGYGGSLHGPHQVSVNDSAEDVGDEALMHARTFIDTASVVISRRRARGAQLIVKEALADVIVLDDGFQHRRLARDLDLVLVDETQDQVPRDILEKRLLPLGLLREDPERAFARAHAVVLVRRAPTKEPSRCGELLRETLPSHIPVFQFRLEPTVFVDVSTGEPHALGAFQGKTGKAITAIATAEAFFTMLESLGLELGEKVPFRDHHHFSWTEWDRIIDDRVAPVFTTAKDAVKLAPFVAGAGQLFALQLAGGFVSVEEREGFWELVQRAMGGRAAS